MKKELLFYNLCEQDVSCIMVEKAIDSGIDYVNIKNMDLSAFDRKYGVRKVDFYKHLEKSLMKIYHYVL